MTWQLFCMFSVSLCVNFWLSARVEENGVDSAPVEKGSDRGRRGKGRGTQMSRKVGHAPFMLSDCLLKLRVCVCRVRRQRERPSPRGQQVYSTGNGVSMIICAHWTQLAINSFAMVYAPFKIFLLSLIFSCSIHRTFNPADYTMDSGTTNSHADVWESGTNDATDGTGKREKYLNISLLWLNCSPRISLMSAFFIMVLQWHGATLLKTGQLKTGPRMWV